MPDNDADAQATAAAAAAKAASDAAATAAAAATSAAPKKLDLTQEDLDKIIADRLKRAIPADYEDLKKLKETADAAAEEKKTELQKAKDAKEKAEADGKTVTAKAHAALRRAAILVEAAAAKAANPGIVATILAGSEAVVVDKDGNVTGAKEAVAALFKDNPYLVGTGTPGASGGQFGGVDTRSLDEKIVELERTGKWSEARDLKIQKMAGKA